MILEIILALLAGLVVGTITGLIPGIHINLVAVLLVAAATSLLAEIPPIALAAFITSVAVTHTFMDFIPAVFLGAPDDDTFLSVLPGHQMLKQGRAYEAIVLTVYGSLAALAVILLFIPVFIYLSPYIIQIPNIALALVLFFVSIHIVLRDPKVWRAIVVFALAGILGYVSTSLPVEQPLLPLLTGLFGASAILVSLKDTVSITPQITDMLHSLNLPRRQFLKAIGTSIIAAPASALLPGLGAGHAAVIGAEIVPQSRRSFLVLLGAINTIVIGLSFIAFFAIDRTRTGAAVAVKEILQQITTQQLFMLIGVIIGTSILAFFLTVFIAKRAAKIMPRLNYRLLAIIVLAIIVAVVLIFSNPLGFVVFITSTALGVFTILSGARRINMMGGLLMPTILFYLIS